MRDGVATEGQPYKGATGVFVPILLGWLAWLSGRGDTRKCRLFLRLQ